MKDTQLYEQLLGLSKPWSVERVELALEAGTVTVQVQCDKGTVWGDPEAPGQRAHVHGWVRREWRHLDTCQLETRIVAEVPRVKYQSGRVEGGRGAVGRALQPHHAADGRLRHPAARNVSMTLRHPGTLI